MNRRESSMHGLSLSFRKETGMNLYLAIALIVMAFLVGCYFSAYRISGKIRHDGDLYIGDDQQLYLELNEEAKAYKTGDRVIFDVVRTGSQKKQGV